MPSPAKRSLSLDRAWSCVMMNVATPGTGSLRARRFVSGIGQLGFALVGFGFGCAWIFKWCHRIFEAQVGGVVLHNSIGWLWKYGLVCFGISWFWTFLTCVNLVRQAKKYERENRKNVPPKL